MQDLSQKKFQEISCISVVLREIFLMIYGVSAQSDDIWEYADFSLSAEVVHQVHKINVLASDSLQS